MTAVPWSWCVYQRAVDPALFTSGGISLWLFGGYSVLTMAGLALVGAALLRTGLPPWVGWMCIGSAAGFVVLGLVFRDMPPFVYYLVTLTVGIAIYRAAPTTVMAAAGS